MAIELLSKEAIKTREPGVYSDGGNLFLVVKKTRAGNLSRSWSFRYRSPVSFRDRWMGLGSADIVSVDDARRKAREFKSMIVSDHLDPLDERRRDWQERRAAADKAITFKDAIGKFLTANDLPAHPLWRSPKHRRDWTGSLDRHIVPKIGHRSCFDITDLDIRDSLAAVWKSHPVTASRIEERVRRVINWIKQGQPPRAIKPTVVHHASLPWQDLPGLLERVRADDRIAASAFLFTAHTAVRISAAVEAEWSEIDLAKGEWRVPRRRLKRAKEDIIIPLSAPVVALLKALPREDGNRFVFAGRYSGQHVTSTSVWQLVRSLAGKAMTVHGTRSAFASWAQDQGIEPAIIDACLQQSTKSQVRAAYQRSDMFDLRKPIMARWSDHLDSDQPANVVRLRARQKG
jgi:integrase